MNDATTPERDLFDALQRSSSFPQIWVERRRYGKEVTILADFAAGTDVLGLARVLKRRLAVGGSVKEGQIEVQGDQRARARAILMELGFIDGKAGEATFTRPPSSLDMDDST